MIRFLQTPGPVKKYVLGGMLLVICGAMLVYLIPSSGGSSFGSGPKRGVVATVAGEEVTALEVQRAAKNMVRQQLPRGGPQAEMLMPYFAQRAAEQLISRKAILTEAERLGLRASDADVREELEHGQYAGTFFPGGKFVGQETYEAMLQRADLTVPMFEESVKNDILIQKMHDLIAGGATVPDDAVRQEFTRRNVKVKFEYAVLRSEEIAKGIHPADAELNAFYERTKNAYANSIPEKRKIQYAVVDIPKIQAQTQVTRADLQSYYDQHQDEFRVPEQVNVRHILIKTPLPGLDGKVDANGVEQARKKAEDVLKQLKAGGKFADLAKKSSEDSSAANGGSLGWIGKGRTVPEFEKAAFSLPKGGTSDLVQSSYGFHIIHVDDKQDAHLKTLDEVKSQIEPVVQKQTAAKAAEAQANGLLTDARASSLDKAAAKRGIQVVATDFVGRGDSLPGIGSAPQFMDAVFNASGNTPPDEAPLPQGFAVFQVLTIKPPSTPTFAEIRGRVESEFRSDRASALLAQKTQELSDRAKTAHDLKKAAKELGATMKTSDFVLPDAQVPDIGSMSGPASVAFSMKPGEISGPIGGGGTGVVLAVLDKQEPAAQEYTAKKDEIRAALLQNKQAELFGLYVGNLRTQMEKSGKIKINQEEMKALTKSRANADEGE